ncbi:hypothetical protein CBR_g54449 [Chara braunii]|uniref:Uncharacterized protein n=1 Tax=Chara braunii TaxID=69332 RepID=A0A388MC56_CHABU|nr:hypothetical protein CBR_g54449 [Chara braunii]|eukprot:GBG92148.1 hypothetical protein CBR_g54449 [Chara braunii]
MGNNTLPFIPDEWFFAQEGKVIRITVSSKNNPLCFKCRQRGHLGTDASCPKTKETVKPKVLKTASLQEVADKKGYWYIPEAQYAGWVFNDNLDTPDWVWTIQGEPTPKPDVYPPYESRWQTLNTGKKSPKSFIRDPVINIETLKQEIWERDLSADLQSVQENIERGWVEAVKKYQGEEREREESQAQKTYVRRRRRGQSVHEQIKVKEMEGTDESMGEGGAGQALGENEELSGAAVGGKRKHIEGQKDRESVDEEQERDLEEGYPWEGLQEDELRKYIEIFEKQRDDNYELQLILQKEELKNKTKAEAASPSLHILLSENPFAPLEKEEEVATYFAEKYCAAKEDQEMEGGEREGVSTERKNKMPKGRQLQKYKPTSVLEEQGKGKGQEDAGKVLSTVAQLGIQLQALEAQNARLTDQNKEAALRTVTVRDIQCNDQDTLWVRARREASILLLSRAVIPIRRDSLANQWEVAVHEDLSVPRWQLGQKREDLLKKISKEGEPVFMGLPGELQRGGGAVHGETLEGEGGKDQPQYDTRPLLICLDHKTEIQDGLMWKPWWWLTELPVTALGSDSKMAQNVVVLASLLESEAMAREAEELPTLLSPFEGEAEVSSSS